MSSPLAVSSASKSEAAARAASEAPPAAAEEEAGEEGHQMKHLVEGEAVAGILHRLEEGAAEVEGE